MENQWKIYQVLQASRRPMTWVVCKCYSILIEVSLPMKLLMLFELRFKRKLHWAQVHTRTHLSDDFPNKNCLKRGDALSPASFNFVLKCWVRNVQENEQRLGKELDRLVSDLC
jgi:hypothetical protein